VVAGGKRRVLAFYFSMLMMFAFITIKNGLVPLIEGLCAQILYFGLRLSVVCVHIFCISFPEEKICQRKKKLVQDLFPP